MELRYFCLGAVVIIMGCNKIVEVPEPTSSITTTETFSTINDANAAITAIYNDMSFGKGILNYSNGLSTVTLGKSADELNNYGAGNDPFETNNIFSNNSTVYNIWKNGYFDIYLTNSTIDGLNASTSLPLLQKNQLIGEAKFLRSFIYFYLVNLYGNLPLVTGTAWNDNSLASRNTVEEVYQQIIADLKNAQAALPPDYSTYGGEKVRANAAAAASLLSRVYLYHGDYDSAELKATSVINNGLMYALDSNLMDVFLKNSSEAILQLQTIGPYNTSQEAFTFIPADSTTSPNYTLTQQLINAFEPGDNRWLNWVDSTNISGTYLYYPFKYKVRRTTSANVMEYYMVLRLAEQYIIRAEARAQINTNLNGAIDDLNIIRSRAGLSPLPYSLSQTQVLNAVAQERRIEFFAEWGHRWLDLKRTGQADMVLAPIKPLWKPSAVLYPIPLQELQLDPNLTQNAGY